MLSQTAKLDQTFKVSNQLKYLYHSWFQLSQTNEKEKTVKHEDKQKLQNWKHEEAYRCSASGETREARVRERVKT